MNADNKLYEQFTAELREQDGNFYFVRKHNKELYDKLLLAESHSITNLIDAGSNLRGALETFQRAAMPATLMPEVYASNAAYRKVATSDQARVQDYQNVFARHPELRVKVNYFDKVREAGNAFHHEPGQANSRLPNRTYAVLCRGLTYMQKLLYYYYTGKENITYHKERQPINEYWVCSSIDRMDITACERQVLGARQGDSISARTRYRLIRQYAAANLKEDAIRDEKVLDSLWSRLRSPRNIVRYSVMDVVYQGDAKQQEEKRLLCYDFDGHRPAPLHEKMIAALSEEQKIMLLYGMTNGVRELHKMGIFHRNLQPNTVYVFFEQDSGLVEAKLVGFEFAKITGDARTVVTSVQDLYAGGDPSAYISLTALTALKNPAAAGRINWAAEDIYSLGALFHLVLVGKPPVRGAAAPELANHADPELTRLITQMLHPAPAARPAIQEVYKVVADFYHLVEEEL